MNKAAILTIILFTCLSCRTIKPEHPIYQDISRNYVPARSVIGIPVEIPLSLINDRINRQFSGLLYQDDSFTRPVNDDLKLKVYMNKRIRVRGNGSELTFAIPLSIHATGRWSACTICPEIQGSTSFEIDVYLTSGIQIGKDFSFRLTTRSDGFEWTSPPVVAIGPLRIPITALLEDVLNKQLRQISGEIDKNVNTKVDLRAVVQSLWNLTAEPILLDESTETWLSVKPEQIHLAPVEANDQRIRLNLGLLAIIETNTGERPATVIPGPLPGITPGVSLDEKFHMQINSGLSFEKTTQLSGVLKGYEFVHGKRKVKIEDIFVFGKGERAYIRLLLSGSVKGIVYLSGLPKFDSLSEELYLSDLNFDFNTRNVLLRSASWLLAGSVEKKLQQSLRFSFRTELAQIRESISNQIKSYKYGSLFELRGSLESFTLRDIFVRDEGFALVFDAAGKAAIYFNRIGF